MSDLLQGLCMEGCQETGLLYWKLSGVRSLAGPMYGKLSGDRSIVLEAVRRQVIAGHNTWEYVRSRAIFKADFSYIFFETLLTPNLKAV